MAKGFKDDDGKFHPTHKVSKGAMRSSDKEAKGYKTKFDQIKAKELKERKSLSHTENPYRDAIMTNEYDAMDLLRDNIEEISGAWEVQREIQKFIEASDNHKLIDELDSIKVDIDYGVLNFDKLDERLIKIRDELAECTCEECHEAKC